MKKWAVLIAMSAILTTAGVAAGVSSHDTVYSIGLTGGCDNSSGSCTAAISTSSGIADTDPRPYIFSVIPRSTGCGEEYFITATDSWDGGSEWTVQFSIYMPAGSGTCSSTDWRVAMYNGT